MQKDSDRLFSMDKVFKNFNRKNLFDFLFKDFDKEDSIPKSTNQFEIDKNKPNVDEAQYKSLVETEPKVTTLNPQDLEYSFRMIPKNKKFNEILINLIRNINNIDNIKTKRYVVSNEDADPTIENGVMTQ